MDKEFRATNCGHDMTELEEEAKREFKGQRPSWFSAIAAVLWGFLGVRKKKDYAGDMVSLRPLHFIVTGLVMGVLLVLLLVALVSFISP